MNLGNKLVYQVFVRNYGEGTFLSVEKDLQRIKDLGVDIIYLLPIHPIGEKERKGSLGSPYATKDYFGINAELGTESDFISLIKATQDLGMKLIMDVVINHSAPDNPYTLTNPEFYYRKKDGKFGNQVGDWWDIIDFDYTNQGLWKEMISMFVYWSKLGVDGFRCDVASFVPVDFWKEAKSAVAEINEDAFWIAESVHKEFLNYRRKEGLLAFSDSELYQAFDVCYDYDIHSEYEAAIKTGELGTYLKMLNMQEMIYPTNYLKLRTLENHDQARVHALTKGNIYKTKQWLAFSFIVKGVSFLYNGQEFLATHTPSLFDKDELHLEHKANDLTKDIVLLKKIKEDIYALNATDYSIEENCNFIHITYRKEKEVYECFFNVNLVQAHAFTVLTDGVYINIYNGTSIEVENGKIELGIDPIIIHKNK